MRDGWLPIVLPRGHPRFLKLSVRKGNSVLENVRKKKKKRKLNNRDFYGSSIFL